MFENFSDRILENACLVPVRQHRKLPKVKSGRDILRSEECRETRRSVGNLGRNQSMKRVIQFVLNVKPQLFSVWFKYIAEIFKVSLPVPA